LKDYNVAARALVPMQSRYVLARVGNATLMRWRGHFLSRDKNQLMRLKKQNSQARETAWHSQQGVGGRVNVASRNRSPCHKACLTASIFAA
jgi:hypothetical protein